MVTREITRDDGPALEPPGDGMTFALDRLTGLLRDLFQLDLADLDFGIYRLLRLKRSDVEAFLTEQLPRRVDEVFAGLASAEQAVLDRDLESLAGRIRSEVDPDALRQDGSVDPAFVGLRVKAARELVQDYEDKRARLGSTSASEVQRAEVFNHLHAFFSRYYEGGDFMPRRRYGARETYAVPYRGEETLLHWANAGQHYVKSSQVLRDYRFRVDAALGSAHVQFRLVEGSTPPDNAKGDARFFFPLAAGVTWEPSTSTLIIPFEYRRATAEEAPGSLVRLQDALLVAALPAVLEAVPEPWLAAVLRTGEGDPTGGSHPLLLRRLRHFTRRAQTDFFVHRDLAGFLRAELEFYLKDQIIQLADLDGDLAPRQRMLRVIRELGDDVIAFLDQVESAQKRLFEKRKLVLRTDYLVPVRLVPRALWSAVLADPGQRAAWQDLFRIDPEAPLDEAFLSGHPTLVVDTSHFTEDFRDELLEAFDDLDGVTGGWLIHGENYQALRVLEPRFAGTVKCIYIDPPYNTGSDDFIYKDRYRHSSWLTMMAARMHVARALLATDGALFASIGDDEQHHLRRLIDIDHERIGTFIWEKKEKGSHLSQTFRDLTEFVLAAAVDTERVGVLYGGPAYEGKWQPLLKRHNALGVLTFPAGVSTTLADGNHAGGEYDTGDTAVHLLDEVRVEQHVVLSGFRLEGRFTWNQAFLDKELALGTVMRVSPTFKPEALRHDQASKTKRPASLVTKDIASYEAAFRELQALFGRADVFSYPKPTGLVAFFIRSVTHGAEDSLVLDYFAGTGTTGDAAIRLCRLDGKRRRFILIEHSGHFGEVLVPRISKAMYTSNWSDGAPSITSAPQDVSRDPRIVKVLRIESYEDALHNLATDATLEAVQPREAAHAERLGSDRYRLNYLLRLPLEADASLLALERLDHPFDYSLEILTDAGPREQKVDLVETFNLIYGIHVERLEATLNQEDGRRYRLVKGRRGDKRVLVAWRDMGGLDPDLERRFLETLTKDQLFDEMLINGDSATPSFRSLDSLFKRLVDEEER